jgi:signal transduction histidine kinase/CheY-like chemotaxis protein
MTGVDIAAAVLTAIGGILLVAASRCTRAIMALLEGRPDQANWRLPAHAMAMFVVCYGVALVLIVSERRTALVPVAGALFFLGSLLVFAVVRRSLVSMQALFGDVGHVANANVLAAELMEQLEDANDALQTTTTELRAAKEDAEAAERLKSRFLANVSHELRTPLNGVLGYVQLLRGNSEVTAIESARAGLETIERSGNHLLHLLNDILDLSKIEAGRMTLLPAPFSPSAVLARVVDLLQIKADESKLDLRLDASSDLPQAVIGDEQRITQVLLNLVGNGLKFTPEGHVSVQATVSERLAAAGDDPERVRLRFEIKDTGTGMSEHDLGIIFAPFQQAKPARSQEGTGLGLAISRNLAQLMGGDLRAYSTPNVGSRFEFEVVLPLANPADLEERAGYTLFPDGYEGPRLRVLVVDDVVHNRELLESLLGRLGFQVDLAANGREALDRAEASRPDLVLMDLAMPVLDGFAATKELRQRERLRDVKVIAVSASKTNLGSGADPFDGFLLKPIDVQTLLKIVEQELSLSWVYPVRGHSTSEGGPADGWVRPPAQVLAEIVDLAEDGDYTALLAVVARLEEEDPRHQPFANLGETARQKRVGRPQPSGRFRRARQALDLVAKSDSSAHVPALAEDCDRSVRAQRIGIVDQQRSCTIRG